MIEETKICDVCNHNLVWHEGSFSGWVHAASFGENQKLVQLCNKIKIAAQDKSDV